MIPKTIHLCWFSGDPYPVEIKVCIDSWKRLLPDYNIRIWNEQDARAIGSDFINEALDARVWAFAADVVRFYAIYTEGGLYMDSDIFLYRRPDEIMSHSGFVTTIELAEKQHITWGLQAAFFAGEKGNGFCAAMLEYYNRQHFILEDGTHYNAISPRVMLNVAKQWGFQYVDKLQQLDGLTIYPARYITPAKSAPRHPEAIGVHRIYGSWRKRKFGRRVELKIKHIWHVMKYVSMSYYKRKLHFPQKYNLKVVLFW